MYILEKNLEELVLEKFKAVTEESEKNGFWTLQSGIIRENEASIELHKKCGFRIVGIREKIAKMDNKTWHDVVFMERRSDLF